MKVTAPDYVRKVKLLAASSHTNDDFGWQQTSRLPERFFDSLLRTRSVPSVNHRFSCGRRVLGGPIHHT